MDMEHSPTSATSTAWATPWRAVQKAAWEALKMSADE